MTKPLYSFASLSSGISLQGEIQITPSKPPAISSSLCRHSCRSCSSSLCRLVSLTCSSLITSAAPTAETAFLDTQPPKPILLAVGLLLSTSLHEPCISFFFGAWRDVRPLSFSSTLSCIFLAVAENLSFSSSSLAATCRGKKKNRKGRVWYIAVKKERNPPPGKQHKTSCLD